eukprot:Clim_evm66s150 gene=Clim_evmTU66s150
MDQMVPTSLLEAITVQGHLVIARGYVTRFNTIWRAIIEFTILALAIAMAISLVFLHGHFVAGTGCMDIIPPVEQTPVAVTSSAPDILQIKVMQPPPEIDHSMLSSLPAEYLLYLYWQSGLDNVFGIFDSEGLSVSPDAILSFLRPGEQVGNEGRHKSRTVEYYEFSSEAGFLALTPDARKRMGLHIATHEIEMDQECISDRLQILINYFTGHEALIGNAVLKKYAVPGSHRGRGFLHNVFTGEIWNLHEITLPEHITFSQKIDGFVTGMFIYSVLTSLLTYMVFDIFSRMFTVSRLRRIRYDFLLRDVTNYALGYIASLGLLVGLLFIAKTFLDDPFIAGELVIMLSACELAALVAARSAVSMIYFPQFVRLYTIGLLMYMHLFPLGYTQVAFFTCLLLTLHAFSHFYHAYELTSIQEIARRTLQGMPVRQSRMVRNWLTGRQMLEVLPATGPFGMQRARGLAAQAAMRQAQAHAATRGQAGSQGQQARVRLPNSQSPNPTTYSRLVAPGFVVRVTVGGSSGSSPDGATGTAGSRPQSQQSTTARPTGSSGSTATHSQFCRRSTAASGATPPTREPQEPVGPIYSLMGHPGVHFCIAPGPGGQHTFHIYDVNASEEGSIRDRYQVRLQRQDGSAFEPQIMLHRHRPPNRANIPAAANAPGPRRTERQQHQQESQPQPVHSPATTNSEEPTLISRSISSPTDRTISAPISQRLSSDGSPPVLGPTPQ